MLNNAFNVLFPTDCLICGKRIWSGKVCCSCMPILPATDYNTSCQYCCNLIATTSQNLSCDVCQSFPLIYKRVRFLWNYNNLSVKHFITAMKYKPSPYLCKMAGEILTTQLSQMYSQTSWDLIVPIPSSKQSLSERLFNQCVILSKAVCVNTAPNNLNKFAPTALIHNGYKTVQASLPHRLRMKNVKRAFSANSKLVQDKRVLLVEDVITTGATTSAASLALKNAGAISIDVVALARAESWQEYRKEVYDFFR